MRLIDLRCPRCGHITIDHFQRTSDEALPLCMMAVQDPDAPAEFSNTVILCCTQTERVHLPTHRNTVISDECDVWVHHGICHENGEPRRYGFKSEMRAVAKSKGMEKHVVHKPSSQEGDSSPHTSRWV